MRVTCEISAATSTNDYVMVSSLQRVVHDQHLYIPVDGEGLTTTHLLTGLLQFPTFQEELQGGFPLELIGNFLLNSPFKKGFKGSRGVNIRKNHVK